MHRYAPRGTADIAEIVGEARQRGRSLAVRGLGTRVALGHPTTADALLDLADIKGVVDYQPSELVITARPATPMQELADLLATERQVFAFEPALRGTLGGALATNDAGPRRFRSGAARDHLLGFEGVTGRGECFVAGGRVVKNVTGYDLSKLVCGSFGTLAILTVVHVKVWPAPATSSTVVRRGQTPAEALATLSAAVASPHDPTGVAHRNGVTAVRVEGPERSVAHRVDELRALLDAEEVLRGDESSAWWAALRDQPIAGTERWRLSVPPSEAAAVLDASQPDHLAIDHAGGRLWLGYDGVGPDVRAMIRQGHATLVAAPDERKAAVGVFPPLSPVHLALEQRVKAQFDPEGILEPGRRGR